MTYLPSHLHVEMVEAGQPDRFFRALDQEIQRSIGYAFMTLLVVDGDEVLRVYSSDEKNYPVSGRKPMTQTPWGRQVIHGKRSFLAKHMDGIRWAFFDHELIERCGGGSAINVPVLYDGICIGTLNLNHRDGFYEESHLRAAEEIAPLLTAPFLQCRMAR